MNYRKVMKEEPNRLISRKLAANLDLRIVHLRLDFIQRRLQYFKAVVNLSTFSPYLQVSFRGFLGDARIHNFPEKQFEVGFVQHKFKLKFLFTF